MSHRWSHALDAKRMARDESKCLIYHSIGRILNQTQHRADSRFSVRNHMMVGAVLLVGRSLDRSPVVSLGIFSEASDKSMCPGSTQPLKMSTRLFLGVKAAGA